MASRGSGGPLPAAFWPQRGVEVALPMVVVLSLVGHLIAQRSRERAAGGGAFAVTAIVCALTLLLARGTTEARSTLAFAAVEAVLDHLLVVFVVMVVVLQAARRGVGAGAGPTDRFLAVLFCLLLLVQSVLGAMQRLDLGLRPFHIMLGGAALMPLAVHIGMRGLLVDTSSRKKLAVMIGAATLTQLVLGILALLVPGTLRFGSATGSLDLALVIAHRSLGLLLLAAAAALGCRCFTDRAEPVSE